MSVRPALTLATTFTKAVDGKPAIYGLELTNESRQAIRDFTLCFVAPTRVDLDAAFDNAVMKRRSSNFVEIAPPAGFVLEPGGRWKTSTADLGRDLRHWSDGANAAYLAFADGTTLPVESKATTLTGDNAPLKRGTEPFPVPGPGKSPAPISVVPWPNDVRIEGARDVPAGLAITASGEAGKAADAFADLARSLFPADGLVRPPEEGGLPVTLETDAGQKPEGYRIVFGDEIAVHAAGHAGWLYGLVTLGQILRGARRHPLTFTFPAGGEIVDAPAFGWRGSHLDVSRQFYSSGEVGQFLKVMAWNKLNRFHWHLTDDEGWRVEIDAYPELTQVGAWRGHNLPMPPLFGSGAARTGGYYTKDAIRQVVALAETFAIDVVPEVDVPGHSFAAITALPWLADPDETGAYYFHDNFPNGCLNPAHEPVYEFVEKVFGELLELFPSKTFHVGADEVPEGAWECSPLARELNEKLGGTGSPAKLQAAFLKRVQKFLTANGRITGAWEEAAMGGGIDRDHAYLVGWTTIEVSQERAEEGYDIVIAPGQRYYLDMANGAAWSEPGASWAGWSGPEETYTFQPGDDWTDKQKNHLLGVQACIWSEHLTDRAIFDRLVFPRLSAIAETGWTRADKKSWPRFRAMAGLLPNLYGYWATE
jgi:hexosaminidase